MLWKPKEVIVLVLVCMSIVFVVFQITGTTGPVRYWLKNSLISDKLLSKANVDRAHKYGQCILPMFDPWDPNTEKHLNLKLPKPCSVNRTLITDFKDGLISIINGSIDLQCKYRCLNALNDRSYETSKWVEMMQNVSEPVNCDFVDVECQNRVGEVLSRYIHTQVKRPAHQTFEVEEDERPSVFMIILDSTSASSAVLRQYYEATEFLYHNKVGLNSRPNANAIFLGDRISTLQADERFFPNKTHFAEVKDSCKIRVNENHSIVHEYARQGYATMIFEDDINYSLQWPSCKAYENVPSHHWGKPYWQLMKKHKQDYNKFMLKAECQGKHDKMFDYTEKFFEEYIGIAKFSYLWLDDAHNSPNALLLVDKDLADFLKRQRENLRKSFIYLMGDHGLRFGSIRNSDVGAHEDNNPLLTIAVPEHLRSNEELMRNLRKNARRHTSHYDVYATLYDIAVVAKQNAFQKWNFHDFRTCEEMMIHMKFCICLQNWSTADINDAEVVESGKALVEQINTYLAAKNLTDDCAELTYDKLIRASVLKEKGYYNLVVKTLPNHGLYEALIGKLEHKYVVVSPITRNDAYRQQGDCALAEDVRPLCYCKNDTQQNVHLAAHM